MGLVEAAMLFVFVLALAGSILLALFLRREHRQQDRRGQPSAGPAYKHNLASINYHSPDRNSQSNECAKATSSAEHADPRSKSLPRCPTCGAATAFLDERCAKCGEILQRD